jgi:L-aspartate oxidase
MAWESTNLLHVGQLLTLLAALREETRGGHLRSDFPGRDDEHWRCHSLAVRHDDGSVTTSVDPVPDQVLA